MAYAAQAHEIPRLAWLLFAAGVLWSVVYDTMYAMVDRDDDLKLGIRSAAITFGDADRWVLGALQLLVLYALWLAGKQCSLGHWFRAGLGAGAVFFLYQQWLIRGREREACFRAFVNNQWFGLVVFAGIVLMVPISSRLV